MSPRTAQQIKEPGKKEAEGVEGEEGEEDDRPLATDNKGT